MTVSDDDDYENPVGEVLDPETVAWIKSFLPTGVVTALVGATVGTANALVKRVFSSDDTFGVDTDVQGV